MTHLARALLQALLDGLAPRSCIECGAATRGEEPFCAPCDATCPPPLASTWENGLELRAASRYDGPTRRAIVELKYRNRADLGEPLGRWAAERWGLRGGAAAQVVPVPLHPSRLVERGYNQSALVARGAAAVTALRARPRALIRVRRTAAQAGLPAERRLANTAGAFVCRAPTHGPLWILDDVVTTGATARACAQALRAGGANVQGVLCLAVAERDREEVATGSVVTPPPSARASKHAPHTRARPSPR